MSESDAQQPESQEDAPAAGSVNAAVEAELELMQAEQPSENGPEEGEPEPDEAGDEADAADDQDAEDESDESTDPEANDADFIDFEKDGKKYRVPKALQDELMLKADYTQKRMQEAEYFKQVQAREAQLPALFETGSAYQQEAMNLAYVRAQKQALLQATDWATLRATDEVAFAARSADLHHLTMQEQALDTALGEKKQQYEAHQERARLDQANRLAATLTRDHGMTPQRFKTVQQEAHARFGQDPTVMQALHDGAVSPAVYLALEELAEYRALKANKDKALQKAREAGNQAQRTVVRAGPAAQPQQRTSNATAKAHQRLVATGSVQDAVALELARMNPRGMRGRR